MLFAAFPRWLRRLIQGFAALLLLLLLLMLISWVALPLWLERQGVRLISEQLGRPVSLEAAHVTPWRLALSLDGLRIGGAEVGGAQTGAQTGAQSGAQSGGAQVAGTQTGAADLLTVKRVEVSLSPRTLWRFTPIVSSLRIVQPSLSLSLLGQGHTDVDDILTRLRGQPKPADEPSKDTPLALYNLELVEGRVQLEDRPAGMVHQLTGLQLGLPFISTLDTDVEVTVAPHLAGQLNGVAFSTEGQAQPFAQKRSASLTFKMEALDLAAYRAYWPKALPARLASGLVDADLTLKFQLPKDQAPELKISGAADLRNLVLQRRADGAGRSAPETKGDGWDDWLQWKRLSVGLADVQPLKKMVLLDKLVVDGPVLNLSRDATGQVWLPIPQGDKVKAGGAAATASASTPAAAVSATGRTSSGGASASAASNTASDNNPWRIGIRELALTQGRVALQDASVSPAAQWQLDDLSLKGRALNWPLAAPAGALELTAALHAAGAAPRSRADAEPPNALLKATAQAGASGVIVDWRADRLSLVWAAPYLRPVTPLQVRGQLALQGQIKTEASGALGPLTVKEIQTSQLEVLDATGPVISLADASLDKLDINLTSRALQLGRLTVKQPQVRLARDAKGAWNWASWTAPSVPAPAPAPRSGLAAPAGRPVLRLSDPADLAGPLGPAEPAVAAAPVAPQEPWRARLAELVVEGGQVQLLDPSTHVLDDEPVRPIGVQDLNLRLASLDWDGTQLRGTMPARLSLIARRPDAKIRNVRDPARLQWDGQLSLAPLRLAGKVQAEHLPLHWADPYLDPSIGIHLQRAEGSFKGDLSLALPAAGPQVQATGDLQLSELRLRQTRLQDGRRRSAEDLLSWQALRLAGFKLQLAPAQVPDIAIRLASLDEFYARLIINEQGRLNLRDLRQTSQGQAVAAVAVSAAASAPVSTVIARAGALPATDAAQTDRAGSGGAAGSAATTASAANVASAAVTTTPPPAPAVAGPPLRLSINGTELTGGRVDFTDRFIKPNYTAQISDLTGTLGRFSAGASDMAPLQLKGRVAGTGELNVSGQINPGSLPLTLDITASATDIELAPLSPYAGKYAGYAIDRGKLSSRVHYRIDPSGQLVADNKIVLNQLSFGERIDSPVATQLPVRLAVALLKDSNGVIDVDLPVSGSINDPEFSVGGVIGKLIVNLLAKALTSPFSLLSGGRGADVSQLGFDPGTAVLPEATDQALDKVAKVLTEKPGLQLSITGWVDPAAERRAAQAARLEEALLNERRRELRRQQLREPAVPVSAPVSAAAATATSRPVSASAASPSGAASSPAGAPPPITLDDSQRQRLLKVVYDNAKLPNKPRNLLGLAKDLPPADMRELLLDSYAVSDEQMRELALQRSVAVRDALIAKGVPNARMFLSSPKLHQGSGSEAGEGGKAPAWTPKVELSLSTQ